MKKTIIGSTMAAGDRHGMWVRKSVLRLNFGGQGKSIIDLLQTYGVDNRTLNRIIRGVEKGILTISRAFKLEIVGKTYDVLMGNIVSNVLLETLKGRNPIEVMKVMFEGMVEIDKLNTQKKIMADLTLQLESSIDSKEKYRLIRKITKVEKVIDASPVKYLDDAGFNSSFVEDIISKRLCIPI